MKKENGVTMVALVVVILILFILSSVTMQVGIRVYNEAKVQNYMSKLKIIQTKVDNIAEEKKDISSYGFVPLNSLETAAPDTYQIFISIITEPAKYNIQDSWSSSDDKVENYYYFSSSDLDEKLGLKGQEMDVVINFETRNVIAKTALKLDGKFYHRQYDIVGGEQLK